MPNQYTPKIPVKDRLLKGAVRTASGCLLFRFDTPGGYGYIGDENNRLRLAHRISYETFVGRIPEGFVIDHLCGIRRCIEPSHLEPVTQKINMRRSPLTIASINLAKTHCPQGHKYTPENTVRDRKRNGTLSRSCRACRNERKRIKRAKIKQLQGVL